jgi:hypothetical protein
MTTRLNADSGINVGSRMIIFRTTTKAALLPSLILGCAPYLDTNPISLGG